MRTLTLCFSYAVKNGVVTLSGEVNSEATRGQAEKIAAVPNVQQVVNVLQTKNQTVPSIPKS